MCAALRAVPGRVQADVPDQHGEIGPAAGYPCERAGQAIVVAMNVPDQHERPGDAAGQPARI